MIITVNGRDLHVELADNSSARALEQLVADGDVTVSMADYGGFEKVGSLPRRLPTNDEQITTQPGDLILYQGDKLALYYASNSWSFTRLGRVVEPEPSTLRTLLGGGTVEARLQLR